MLPPIRIKPGSPPGRTNAHHNTFGVWIYAGARYAAAVLAQEVYEWRFLRLVGLGVLTPFAVAGAFLGGLTGIASVFLGLCAAILSARIPPIKRRMALRGRMCEVLTAVRLYGADYEATFAREAWQLSRYDYFKHHSEQAVIQGMKRHETAADKWVRAKLSWLARWKDKLETKA